MPTNGPVRELSRQQAEALLDARDVTELRYDELCELFEREPGMELYLPDGYHRVDPRSDDRVVFNQARARRPHDNQPRQEPTECLVCSGRITRIVDLADLTGGFTFINKNLFPILHPRTPPEVPQPQRCVGLHFLQWTSSLHERDWHDMPLADRCTVLGRLACLEQTLLHGARTDPRMSENRAWGDEHDTAGYVGIIKNYGHLVGGSIEHGHQQIGLSNVMPRRFLDNLRFEQRCGETYARHILRENPADLVVADYGPAVLLVPHFMRRPYDMQLVLRDPGRRYLFQLDDDELAAVARGWGDAIAAIREVMPAMGRQTAYNVVTHNGPGAGLYFELLPYTQETGGFEHLGLIMCQGSPALAARQLREIIACRGGPV